MSRPSTSMLLGLAGPSFVERPHADDRRARVVATVSSRCTPPWGILTAQPFTGHIWRWENGGKR